jgi:hypothetical protein
MRKHGRTSAPALRFWTQAAQQASSRKRIQVSCEPGRRSFLWQLDPASPIVIKH